MPAINEVILYVAVFISTYVQVFFLIAYLEKRRSLKEEVVKGDDSKLPSIALLIPCWNEEKTIDETIRSLRTVDYPKEKLSILVVDDGSTDNTWQVLKKYEKDPDIRIFHQENGGRHSALNHALRHAEADLVCSIDADTILETSALRRMAQYFIDKRELAAVGGNVLIHSPKTAAQKAQSVEYQMFTFSKKLLAMLGAALVAPGAFSVFRTEPLKKVGGWLRAHNLEDLELTYRMHVAGYKVDHCHLAHAYTYGPVSVRALFRQRLRWGYGFLRNTYDYRSAMFNKRFGNFGVFTLPMSVLAYFVILSVFFLSWVKVLEYIINKMTAVSLVGLGSAFSGEVGFNLFFVNTNTLSLMIMLSFFFLFLTIFLGRRMAKVRDRRYLRVVWFFVLYSLILPFWVLRSVYNAIKAHRPAWR